MPITTYDYSANEYRTWAEGCVVSVFTNTSFQIMSDVWGTAVQARVWDRTDKRLYVTTVRVYDGPSDGRETGCHAEVDATEEVWEEIRASMLKDEIACIAGTRKDYNARISKGDTVTVTRGRTNKGTTGKVVVEIYRDYKMGWKTSTQLKYGIATSEVKVRVPAANGRVYENYRDVVWVWAQNCDLTSPKPVDMEEVIKDATAKVDETIRRMRGAEAVRRCA